MLHVKINLDVVKQFELWQSKGESIATTVCEVGPDGDQCRAMLDPDVKLIWHLTANVTPLVPASMCSKRPVTCGTASIATSSFLSFFLVFLSAAFTTGFSIAVGVAAVVTVASTTSFSPMIVLHAFFSGLDVPYITWG
jgi:hypothetical protein